jgi:hypothetical protein
MLVTIRLPHTPDFLRAPVAAGMQLVYMDTLCLMDVVGSLAGNGNSQTLLLEKLDADEGEVALLQHLLSPEVVAGIVQLLDALAVLIVQQVWLFAASLSVLCVRVLCFAGSAGVCQVVCLPDCLGAGRLSGECTAGDTMQSSSLCICTSSMYR